MFKIESNFVVHEEGTKFYQLYKVSCETCAVVVTHHGAYNGGADITPGSHGQSEVFPFTNTRDATKKYADMFKSKSKRGYVAWKGTKEQKFTDRTVFTDAVKGIFNGKAVAILAHFETAMAKDPDFNMGKAKKPAPKQSEPAIDRGPLWGEWA